MEPGTEVPIHKHPTKDETFVILECARGQVPGMNRPNASEKVQSSPRRFLFFGMISKNAIF